MTDQPDRMIGKTHTSVLVNGRPYQLPEHTNYKAHRMAKSPKVHVGLSETGESFCGDIEITGKSRPSSPDDELCSGCQDGLRRMGLLTGK